MYELRQECFKKFYQSLPDSHRSEFLRDAYFAGWEDRKLEELKKRYGKEDEKKICSEGTAIPSIQSH